MALDSIKAISEAEERARGRIAEAAQKAQKSASDEKSACEAEYAERIAEAEKKAAAMLEQAQAEAEEKAAKFLSSTEVKNAINAVRAESRFDGAIELIIGKVVRG